MAKQHLYGLHLSFLFAGGFLPLTHLLLDDLPPNDLIPTVRNKFSNCAATVVLSTFLILVFFTFMV